MGEYDLEDICQPLCDECDERVEEKDFFECKVCGCTFAVIEHEQYKIIRCPICSNIVKINKVSTLSYKCLECGKEFILLKPSEFVHCPYCCSENVVIL